MFLYPKLHVKRASHITPEGLVRRGIRGLVLDVDNTLATHDHPQPAPDIAQWLQEVQEAGISCIILSNNCKERVEPFAAIFNLPFVSNGKKPLKKGFIQATQALGLTPQEIGVVGDQLFTDIWGGNRFGAFTILVDPLGPETLFTIRLKRKLERPILRRYHKIKKKGRGL